MQNLEATQPPVSREVASEFLRAYENSSEFGRAPAQRRARAKRREPSDSRPEVRRREEPESGCPTESLSEGAAPEPNSAGTPRTTAGRHKRKDKQKGRRVGQTNRQKSRRESKREEKRKASQNKHTHAFKQATETHMHTSTQRKGNGPTHNEQLLQKIEVEDTSLPLVC